MQEEIKPLRKGWKEGILTKDLYAAAGNVLKRGQPSDISAWDH